MIYRDGAIYLLSIILRNYLDPMNISALSHVLDEVQQLFSNTVVNAANLLLLLLLLLLLVV